MSKNKLFIASLFIALTCSSSAVAQEYGLELLTIGPSTRAFGLNDAVTAELLGASNLYTNPANLALENNTSLNADYTLWIGDIDYTHAGINMRRGSQAVAFGFIGSQGDDFELRNQPGPAEGTFSVSFLSLSGGYAYQFGPVALGGTVQYIREDYYIYNASGYAASLGAAAQLWNDRIRIGTSLLNMGEMNELRNEATPMPTTFKFGANAELLTFMPPENDDLPITVFLKGDIVKPIKSTNNTTQEEPSLDLYSNIAVEFDVADVIAIRGGYKTGDTERHWSAGAGITVGSIVANYAMVPFSTGYGTAHSVGISYYF